MKILPTNYAINLTEKNLPATYGRFQTLKNDTYTSSSNVKTPSFGHNPMKTAQEVLKNPSLREKFITFLQEMFVVPKKVGSNNIREYAEYTVMAALALFGVASASKTNDTGLNSMPASNEENTEPLKDWFKIILVQNSDAEIKGGEHEDEIPPSVGKKTDINKSEPLQDADIETMPVEDEKVLNEAIEGSLQNEKQEAEQGIINNTYPAKEAETLTETDIENNNFRAIYPKSLVPLTPKQRELKSIAECTVLPLEYSKQLTAICLAATDKTYTTSSGAIITSDAIVNVFTKKLSELGGIIPSIENVYTSLKLDDVAEIQTKIDELYKNSRPVPERYQREYLPVEFPTRRGHFSDAQKALREFVANIKLPKEEGERLTYLCTIAIAKEFKTPNDKIIYGKDYAEKLIEQLKNTDDVLDFVNNEYKNVTCIEQIADISNDGQSVTENYAAKDGNALTSLEEIRQNPPQLKILGKLDTSGIDYKKHSFAEDLDADMVNHSPAATENGKTDDTTPAAQKQDKNSSVKMNPSSAVQTEKAPSVISDDDAEVYDIRPKNTETDARIRFRFSTPPVARSNNIFEPPTLDNEDRLNWVNAGGLAMLLSDFRGYTRKDSDNYSNLAKYARNIYIKSENITDEDDIAYANTLAVRPIWATNNDSPTVKEIMNERKITSDDLVGEMQRKYYKHIGSMLSQELRGGTARENSNIIQDVLTILNDKENQKYFQHFTIHSAMRFIERYIITSKDPQQQCKKALPVLFNMLEEQLSDDGVDVTSHFSTKIISHRDRYGKDFLTVVCNPNIVIYPKSSKERKLFGSHGIIIGIAEYKSPDGYQYVRMEPIIKTIESENPNNIFDSLR